MEYKDVLSLLAIFVGLGAIVMELWLEYKFKEEEKRRK